MNKTARVYELIACVVLAIYSLVMIVHAYLNPVTTKVTGLPSYTFPVAIYAIMLGICIVLIAINRYRGAKITKKFESLSEEEKRQLDEEEKGQYVFQRLDKRVIITIGMIIAYAVGWNILGFSLSTLLFVTLEAKILNKGNFVVPVVFWLLWLPWFWFMGFLSNCLPSHSQNRCLTAIFG
jgi:uncharacterized membrane protein YhdT